MVNLLLKWVLGALALLAVTYIVPGFRVVSLPSALVAVVVIGFLNMTLGLVLKVTPSVHDDGEVTLEISSEFKVLGATDANGNPSISSRKTCS